MSVRASEEWLEQYKEQHPDRVSGGADEPNSGPHAGAGGGAGGTPTPGNGGPADGHAPAVRAARIRVPAVPPSLNEIIRMHWSDLRKKKKAWATLVRSQQREGVHTPVQFTYHMARPGLLDMDNLYGSSKILIDALVRAGVLPDDDPQCVASIEASQERAGDDEEYVLMQLQTLDS